jgi:S-adenosylmethionine:tRNA ribosyltransferase-isomerase
VELLFLHEVEPEAAGKSREVWEVLARPSSRLRIGTRLFLAENEELALEQDLGEGRWQVSLSSRVEGAELLERHGSVPLPPYIKRALANPADYQTVYALPPGSAAAPTAGLHFTPALLRRLVARGVRLARVTLHVGLDTFRPVTADRLEDHVMHREAYAVETEELANLDRARSEGRRLVAVGTTAVRVLETLYATSGPGEPASAAPAGHTSIFIMPGHRFRAVDALLTNFHLPRTSLLALVMAFAGAERLRAAYEEAVLLRYRFFSFGDAMLITEPKGPKRA